VLLHHLSVEACTSHDRCCIITSLITYALFHLLPTTLLQAGEAVEGAKQKGQEVASTANKKAGEAVQAAEDTGRAAAQKGQEVASSAQQTAAAGAQKVNLHFCAQLHCYTSICLGLHCS
jgi:hypothetical protein